MYPSVRRVAYHAGNVLRDAAGSIDRAGMRLQGSVAYRETLCRHRRVQPLVDKAPKVSPDAFIAPSASLIGNVELGQRTSVWYGASLRGDVSKVRIGAGTTIGDRAVINVPDFKRRVKDEHPDTVVGERCVIGHGAILQGCTIGDECIVEMGAIVNEGAVLEKNSVLAPSSVLAPGEKIPTGQLWSGSPAKFERQLSAAEIADIAKNSENHYLLSRKHLQVHHEFEQEMRAVRDFEARDPGQDWKLEKTQLFDAADPAATQPRIGEVPNKI